MSEVATLIEVDDAFVLSCAEVIRQVRRPCRKHGQKSSFNVTLVLNKRRRLCFASLNEACRQTRSRRRGVSERIRDEQKEFEV